MNLFVVLIPLLLLSAVFIEVSVIEMNQSSSDEPFEPPKDEPLALAIQIHDGSYVVEGNGIESKTIMRTAGLVESGEPDEQGRFPEGSLLGLARSKATEYWSKTMNRPSGAHSDGLDGADS